MGSCYSDSFSFLDSESQPLAHSFSFLSESPGTTPNTPHGGATPDSIGRPSLSGESRNCSSFDSAYEKYIQSRDSDSSIPLQPRRVG